MRPIMIVAGVALLTLAGCGSTPTGEPATAPTPAAAATRTPTAPPTATPDPTPSATMTADCDYLLAESLTDPGGEFVATAFVTNTGDVPAKVKITATWRQAGHKPISKSRTVIVAVGGEDFEVTLNREASGREISRIQAIEDYTKQCDVDAKIIREG